MGRCANGRTKFDVRACRVALEAFNMLFASYTGQPVVAPMTPKRANVTMD